MKVFYPINTTPVMEARLYAMESVEYTTDFKNWGDKHKKMQRLITGNFAQYWVYEFCRLNGVPYQKDNTTPYENDKFDIKVCGKVVDIKASVNESLVGQVTKPSLNGCVDFFSFFLVDKRCSYVAPCGVISKDDYKKNCIEVKHGELIPGTRLENRFDVSYFIDLNLLSGFVQFFLIDMKKKHTTTKGRAA